MSKKIILFLAGMLVCLNVLCWKEVFVLAKPGYLLVDFLNVGQGDSAFIRTPEDYKILIDGGPDSAVLEKLNKLLPFWDKSLDIVILSHPEKDHMSGLLDVLEKYKVKYFLWSGVVKDDPENKKLAEILNNIKKPGRNFLMASLGVREGTKVLEASAGEEIKAGSVLIDVLFPLENVAGKELKNSSNDACVVNKIIYGKNSFLFTGDISSVAEKELINNNSDLQSDVLKVAHHGSKYSTSDIFLSAVKPKSAVISVGAKNTYGHPTPEVLQRLEKSGIKVLRTDQRGDVKILSDGNKINLYK